MSGNSSYCLIYPPRTNRQKLCIAKNNKTFRVKQSTKKIFFLKCQLTYISFKQPELVACQRKWNSFKRVSCPSAFFLGAWVLSELSASYTIFYATEYTLHYKKHIWIPLPTSPLRCLSHEAQSSRKMEAAIYLGTLKLSHPQPRGVVEIRASGDLCHFLLRGSLNAAGRLLFSHLHTDTVWCICAHACMGEHIHLHTTPSIHVSLLKAFEKRMRLLSPLTPTPF